MKMTLLRIKSIARVKISAFLLPFLIMHFVTVKASFPELSFDIFTQEDGLPHNQIRCIYQDSRGWIWIGASQGLSRFDGYTFRNFLPDPSNSNSLRNSFIQVIREDSNGNLLIGTEDAGLNVMNRETEQFSYMKSSFSAFKFKDISVNDIAEDRDGVFYLGTDAGLMLIDTSGVIVQCPLMLSDEEDFSSQFVLNLQFDSHGVLWIGTNNGLYYREPYADQVTPFPLPSSTNQNREIWELFLDDEGLIWVGTYSAGLFIISTDDYSVRPVTLEPASPRTETVRAVSKGAFGEYWIGTRGGLYSYSKVKGVTGFYMHDKRNPRSISNNSVSSIYNDSRGETWIGTRGGLNLLVKSKQVFHHYGALPDDDNYLNSSAIYAFWIDDEGKIWIGTEDGGINILNPETGKYTYLMANERDPNAISQNCIKAFLDDKNGNLWVGTFLGGINVINLKTRRITHYKNDLAKPGTLSDNRVWDFCLDRNGDIWIATSCGVDRFDRETGTFEHHPHLNGTGQVSWIEPDSKGNIWMGSAYEVIVYNPESNSMHRFVESSRSMYEDSYNRIWVATIDKGIAIYTAENGPLNYFSERDGLAANHALCILEDQNKILWISTTNGLSKFNAEQSDFHTFTSKDGLSNNQFCYGAALKTNSGKLLFGTVSGFNLFDPSEVITDEPVVPVVLTDLKVFNKSVPIGEGKKPILHKSISETDHIILNYDQNMFTVEFAALDFVNSDKNLYSYILEGFNRNWNEPGFNRTATFTNLNPGDYLLRIKRVVPASPDSESERLLKITILPPIWKTTWFLTLLFLLILFLIYTLVRFLINRENIKNQLVIERVNARKLHELNMMKLKFFTNISHEIRTPLTLIVGPLEKILNQDMPQDAIRENLKLVGRNAKNLDKLISQLLDFRKLEAGNLKLNLTEGDIVEFVRSIVYSFNDLSFEKEIKLTFNTLKKSLFTTFDPDKIEKILNNLLSNSFKFTEVGGSISVNLSLVFDSDENDFSVEEKERQYVEISVKDTGRGIPAKNMNKIFQRFFQADDEAKDSGTGIGLSLVKELVTLHDGKIFVTSKPERGTKFTIRIPYLQAAIREKVSIEGGNGMPEEKFQSGIPKSDMEVNLLSKIMLIVEDNADMRQFIAGHFNSSFTILEARNGEEGWEKALETVPDIIISDVMMPVMNGYEFCKRVKNDERTSHIPVLLLTALHSEDNEIKGLTTGADDYITKPFDLPVLQAKVESILSIRKLLKERFSRSVMLEPGNVVLTSPDEQFLQKAIEVVEQNISDADLDIESFSEMVGVSRMQLYRKFHALTDMTVKEFIRSIRLKRATQMLLQNKLNISEIAYEVGFKDLSHFRKCFKCEYGMSATEYLSKANQK